MYKKVIASLLSCVMLISISPAVAAEDAPVKPSIEEILNDFHQKAFAAEAATERGASTTYSCNSSSDNNALVQETVDALNDAGYEAYNVTASNYEILESDLKTDFTRMGLDPNGSYIVVISGEDGSNTTNINSRAGRLPEQTIIDDGSGAPTHFYYTYDGTTYTMRYVTITLADTTMPLKQDFNMVVTQAANPTIWDFIMNTAVCLAIDHVLEDYAPATFYASVAIREIFNHLGEAENFTGFTISGSSVWTLQYIEVYSADEGKWYASQRSEYAISSSTPFAWVYNMEEESLDMVFGNKISFRTKSELYDDLESRKLIAVQCFHPARMLEWETTGNLIFTVTDSYTGTQFSIGEGYTLTQPHWMESYYP